MDAAYSAAFAALDEAEDASSWESEEKEYLGTLPCFQITEPEHMTNVLCDNEAEWNALLLGRDPKTIGDWILRKLDAHIDRLMDEAIAEQLKEAA